MYLVGRTTGYRLEITDESFAALRQAGMTVIEHSLAQKTYYEPKEVAELTARHGIKLWSCHLPFRQEDASSLDRDMRAQAFSRYCEEVKKGAACGVDKFVMHPGTPFADESERPERLKRVMDFANELAEVAHREGAVIAVEDMPHCIGQSIDELEAIVSTNPKLRVCFDVNHLLHNTHDDFIHRLGDKIVTVHFSDYDFVDERHLFPTEGQIPWVQLIKKLYGSGYTGPWIYECGWWGKSPQTFYDTAAAILKEAGVPEIL
jgi:sugar phosphate isomerase/epimerase